MSIAVMTWSWGTKLPPAEKLVLMAIADDANDEGECWPSVNRLAQKCSVSKRTIQRIIVKLIDLKILATFARYKNDGTRSSNQYRILFKTPSDNLSPSPDANGTPPVTVVSACSDTAVTLTTTEPYFNHQPQQPLKKLKSSVGENASLIFPTQLSEQEIVAAKKLLINSNEVVSQQILDEVSYRISKHSIHSSPLSYLRKLTELASIGKFTPEVGLKIAAQRARDKTLLANKSASTLTKPNNKKIAIQIQRMHSALSKKQ